MIDFPITLNNVTFQASDILEFLSNHEERKAMEYIIKITGCSAQESREVVREIKQMISHQSTGRKPIDNAKRLREAESKQTIKQNVPTCPKCGSTYISTGARGVDGFWGFLGASRTVNRCANCGHSWEPRG